MLARLIKIDISKLNEMIEGSEVNRRKPDAGAEPY